MTKKTPPESNASNEPDPPTAVPPGTPPGFPLDQAQVEALLQGLPMDTVMEILAKAAAKAKGMEGETVRDYVQSVKAQTQALATQVAVQEQDMAGRRATAEAIENLLETVMKTGMATGKALEPYREQIRGAFAGADLSKVGEGMRLLAEYLQNPSEDLKARTQSLLGELENTLGPLVGYDPDREDRERREQIRNEVKANVEAIFAQRPKPTIEFKPKTPLPGSDDESDDNDDK